MEDTKPERDQMPGWIPGLLIRTVLVVLATLATLWLFGQISALLINLLAALFLSFALEPAVAFLARKGWKRSAATTVVFIGAVLMAVGFFAIMLPPIVRQVQAVGDRVPDLVLEYGPQLEELIGQELSLEALSQQVGDLQAFITDNLPTLTSGVTGVFSGVGRVVISALTVALFTFFLLADGPKLRRRVFSLFPPDRQVEIARMWNIAIEKTGGYVASRLVLATFSAVFSFVAFVIIGVPDALALGVWVGVISQFIPAVGTYIASIVPLFVAFVDAPIKALWVLIVLVAYQQVENLLLAPRVTSRTMSLHPAVGFGAAIAGISVLGALGALIALPTAAIIQAFISAYFAEHPVDESQLAGDAMG